MRRKFVDRQVDSANEIVEFDLQDVRDADIILVNYNKASIGTAIATRAIMADLRAGGEGLGGIGGPPPFAKTDRSRFLSALDEALVRLARAFP